MRGLFRAALLASSSSLLLIPAANAEIIPFSYSGSVIDASDQHATSTTTLQFLFDTPQQTLQFQGLNDINQQVTAIQYELSFSLTSNLDIVSQGGPQALVNESLAAETTFLVVSSGISVSANASGGNAAANIFDYLGTAFSTAGPVNDLAPTSTFGSLMNGSILDPATLATFTNDATVDVRVSSVFSNSFFDIGSVDFVQFDPFQVNGTLEITFTTAAATPAPIPGSVLLLAAGLGLLSFRVGKKS